MTTNNEGSSGSNKGVKNPMRKLREKVYNEFRVYVSKRQIDFKFGMHFFNTLVTSLQCDEKRLHLKCIFFFTYFSTFVKKHYNMVVMLVMLVICY